MKKTLRMKEWCLNRDLFSKVLFDDEEDGEIYVYENDYFLCGVTDEYPDVSGDIYIQVPSPVINHSVKEDVLTYETEDAIYVCPFGHMKENPYASWEPEWLEELEELVKEPENEIDCILYAGVLAAYEVPLASSGNKLVDRVREWLERRRQERLAEIKQKEKHIMKSIEDKDNCVYIAFSDVCQNKMFYHIGEKNGALEPLTYWSSSNENRELYLLYEADRFSRSLDFRFLTDSVDGALIVRTYNWTGDVERAIIKNETTNRKLRFNGEIVMPGETKVFTKETHEQGIVVFDEM